MMDMIDNPQVLGYLHDAAQRLFGVKRPLDGGEPQPVRDRPGVVVVPAAKSGDDNATSVTTTQVSHMMSVGRGNTSERRQIGFHYTSRNFST